MRRICAYIFLAVLTSILVNTSHLFAVSRDMRVIPIGGLMDTTGATSDVGKDYALGMDEAFKFINEQGGVNGKKIKYIWFDYSYSIPEAITKYKVLKRLGVLAIAGWGTGDTEALSPTVNKDKIPYVSASYSAHLTDTVRTRYNLFFSSDYSTHARSCITAWFDNKWPTRTEYGKRKPRLACCYNFGSPYASAPIRALKDQAKLLGFETGPDQDVSMTALDTKSQVMALKKFKPDLLWHGNTTMSVSATICGAYGLGLRADHIVNIWGFDENLPRLAGDAMNAKNALTVMGATPCAFYGQSYKNMDIVVAMAKKYNPDVPQNKRLIRTVQAWCNALMLWEAMKRADKAGGLTGPGIIKKGFETMRGFDIGLSASPVTFSHNDHRPTSSCLIQEWKDGKFQEVERVDIKKRWPNKWEREWHGW